MVQELLTVICTKWEISNASYVNNGMTDTKFTLYQSAVNISG